MTRAATDHARRCLHQVWQELTGRGFAVDEPTAFCCMCSIYGLHGMQAMMDLAITGALVTEFIPCRWPASARNRNRLPAWCSPCSAANAAAACPRRRSRAWR